MEPDQPTINVNISLGINEGVLTYDEVKEFLGSDVQFRISEFERELAEIIPERQHIRNIDRPLSLINALDDQDQPLILMDEIDDQE